MNLSKKTATIIIAILALIAVAALGVTMWALFFREPPAADDGNKTILPPDYAPQKQEQNAETIPDYTGEKMEASEGGGAVSLNYSNKVTIDISDEAAGLYFANPDKSNQDMVIKIAIQDTVLIQSETLKPGNQVKLLSLADGAEEGLHPGSYEGKLIVLYYDPIDGERSIVNTEIPITINVVG